mmetsp:Transcript_8704/g.12998  ORF Transcript_8704/g.12998 Transcript_8704/m.12998 type:complete len:147 (+) Transcript_8704:37-477(+)
MRSYSARDGLLGSLFLAIFVVVAFIATFGNSSVSQNLSLPLSARVASAPCVARPSVAVMAEANAPIRQRFEGRVVSTNLQDSAVVRVERLVKHPKYHKRVRLSKKYIIHDPENTAEIGDIVKIASIKPISKRKTFELDTIVRKALK